jgi:hypothetical protein
VGSSIKNVSSVNCERQAIDEPPHRVQLKIALIELEARVTESYHEELFPIFLAGSRQIQSLTYTSIG